MMNDFFLREINVYRGMMSNLRRGSVSTMRTLRQNPRKRLRELAPYLGVALASPDSREIIVVECVQHKNITPYGLC